MSVSVTVYISCSFERQAFCYIHWDVLYGKLYHKIYKSMVRLNLEFFQQCGHTYCILYNVQYSAVLWIRIRMDPELLPVSGSGIKVPDPDPAKSKRAYK